jgi:hypothetical protein
MPKTHHSCKQENPPLYFLQNISTTRQNIALETRFFLFSTFEEKSQLIKLTLPFRHNKFISLKVLSSEMDQAESRLIG